MRSGPHLGRVGVTRSVPTRERSLRETLSRWAGFHAGWPPPHGDWSYGCDFHRDEVVDAECAGDRLSRIKRWVADFTVAFVVDLFSRAIVGWSASTSKRAKLVLDALDMALWRRDRAGTPFGPGLVHHSDAGRQYTSFAFTAHLLEAGIDASIGTAGEALDDALMESQIGL
ncbi:hypothetical protein DMH12_02020 [Streptomyces sp. WAC 04229]|nr:hypothetical protein DMH12_02020 [Streptomyces sp. WAC 04229]